VIKLRQQQPTVWEGLFAEEVAELPDGCKCLIPRKPLILHRLGNRCSIHLSYGVVQNQVSMWHAG